VYSEMLAKTVFRRLSKERKHFGKQWKHLESKEAFGTIWSQWTPF